MRTPFRSSVATFAAALWVVASLAFAAPPASAQDAFDLEPAELAERVGDLYEASDADGVLALRPRASDTSVRLIEIRDSTVTINQAAASPEVVRAWLGDDGDLILALAALPADERFDLFALRAAEDPPEPPSAAAPASPEADEDEDPRTEDRRDEDRSDRDDGERRLRHRGEEVRIFGSLTVPADESVREAVAIFGSVRVRGESRGDVVAVFGSVTIDGTVDGSVTSVFGSVRLTENARVSGDVTTVSGSIQTRPGAVIRGSRNEVGLSDGWQGSWEHNLDGDWHDFGFWATFWAFFWEVVSLCLVLVLAAIVVLVAPQQVGRVAEAFPRDWLKGGLVGFLAVVTFLPLFVLTCILLAVSIVGIPVLILLVALSPFWIVVLLLLSFVGYVGVASWLGRWVMGRRGRPAPGPYVNAFVGIVLLAALGALGDTLEHLSSWLLVPAWGMELVGLFLGFVAWVIGIGLLILDFLARRASRNAGWQPPPPPASGQGPDEAYEATVDPATQWDAEPPSPPEDSWTLESRPLDEPADGDPSAEPTGDDGDVPPKS